MPVGQSIVCIFCGTNVLLRGKEKFPSLSFEVVVDHERRIHSCTEGFVGTAPDNVIVVNDEYCRAIAGGLYKEVEFSLYNGDGTFTTFRGAYLISDGGYSNVWMFQKPMHNACDPASIRWSEFLESVRKDVECTFGILKARFLFLKSFVAYHSADTLTNAMRTACVLHNMLLSWDAGANLDWENLDPDAWDADLAQEIVVPTLALIPATRAGTGLSIIPHTLDAQTVVGSMHRHKRLKDALISHFDFAYKRGCIVWPKGFSAEQRIDFPIVSMRKDHNVLYKAPSYLCARRPGSDQYDVRCGTGLFSCVAFHTNEKIAQFVGDVVSTEVYNERDAAGRGGYAVRLSASTVLDCYEHKSDCFASFANTARGCVTLQGSDGKEAAQGAAVLVAVNNCRLGYTPGDLARGVVYLVASKVINAHIELLWPYGPAYVMPSP